LATVFCASDDQGKVQGEDALVGEERWNVAIRDALREPFDDGCLAYARLTDKNGIVLGAAAENLDDSLDFPFAPDERVQ